MHEATVHLRVAFTYYLAATSCATSPLCIIYDRGSSFKDTPIEQVLISQWQV